MADGRRRAKDCTGACAAAPAAHHRACRTRRTRASNSTHACAAHRYVPRGEPPSFEDHKRLLLLLLEMGGPLLHYSLLGVIAEPLLSVETLAELATFARGLGAASRRVALASALAAAASPAPDVLAAAAAELRSLGLCSPVVHRAREGVAGDGDGDGQLLVTTGVRTCAVLLLRSGQSDEAIAVLAEDVATAPTMHAFLGAFEVGARLPHPPPHLIGAARGRMRFSLEQMLQAPRPSHGQPSCAYPRRVNCTGEPPH